MSLSGKWSLLSIATVSVLVVALVLTGCAGPEPEPTETVAEAPTEAPTEAPEGEQEGILRVSAPPWIFKKFPLEDVAARFEKDHPGVTVELTRVDKWNAPAYITDWKNGETPVDVFVGGSGSMLGPVIAGDWLEPMDGMLTDHMAADEFVGGFLAAGYYKKPDGSGAYYPVLPYMGEVAIIGVNTELMDKAGLMEDGYPVPIPGWGEDEFFGWFEKLGEQSPTGAHVQIWDREFMQYDYCAPIMAMGEDCFTAEGFDVSSEVAEKWLGYVQKMNEEGLGAWTVTDDDGYSKWKTGAAGSFFAAQGHIMELVSVTEDDSDIAYLGWPGAEQNGSIIWTHSVWMPRVSPNKELGKAFIREQIFSKHFQQWSFNNYGKLPVMKDYYGEGITWFQDQMPTILAVADASKPVPLYTDMQEYLDILVKYLPEAAFGRMEVEEALQAVQEESANLDFTDLRASAEEAAEEEPAPVAELEGILRVSAPPWIFKKFPLEDVAARFEKDHPGVTVELTRVDKWNAPAYITDWKNGETPVDVFVGGSGSMLGPVIAGDWLEPMDGMLTDHMAADEFVGGFLAAGYYKKPDGSGAYYPVLPYMGEVAIIGVNTELMDKAGLMEDGYPVPIPGWGEDEFFGWFEKLGEQSPTGAHVQIWDREFMQYDYCAPIMAMGEDCFTAEGFDVSSEVAEKWLGYVQKMNEEGLGAWTVTDDDGYSKWKTGAAGSFFAAQGHIMELVSVTEDDSDIAYLGWPGAEQNGSIIWTHSVWMPRVSPNKELGKAFIREQIFSKHFQQWSFNNYGKLPVMKDYYGEGITWFQDQMPTILAVADASKPVPLYTDMQEYLDILVKYLPEAAFGRMEVEEALQAVQEESANLDFTDLRSK